MKKIIPVLVVMLAGFSPLWAILCERDIPTQPPTSCGSYTYDYDIDDSWVSGCSGGGYKTFSNISDFEVWAGCSSSNGSGSSSNPIVQTPSNIGYAYSDNRGGACYCQIKSINGVAVASSPRWVYYGSPGSASDCASVCGDNCGVVAMFDSVFRSALFSALGS